jgi:hypothetical protein
MTSLQQTNRALGATTATAVVLAVAIWATNFNEPAAAEAVPAEEVSAGDSGGSSALSVRTDRRVVADRAADRTNEPRADTSRGFDALFDEFVDVMLAMRAADADGGPTDVTSSSTPTSEGIGPDDAWNVRLSRLLEGMIVGFPDAGPRALSRTWALTDAGQGPRDPFVLRAAEMVIEIDFQFRRDHSPTAESDVRNLAGALLTQFPASFRHAELAHGLLVDKPYLDPTHEPHLLEILADPELDPRRTRMARELLVTLWTHHADSPNGVRITDLLAYLDGADESLRAAAMHRLLLHDRYRDFVLERVIATKDSVLMGQVASILAEDVDPRVALEGIAEMISTLDAPTEWLAYGRIAERDRDLVVGDYYESLAARTRNFHRRMLVAGLAIAGEPGTEVFETAATQDPDPRTRDTALLALGTRHDSESFERVFMSLLDRENGDRSLQAYGAALRNHARRAEPNALDRMTTRLLALPALDGVTRQTVQNLRRQYLPNLPR